MKDLEINAALQIGKSREEVFEAIVDPEKMAHYFISESTGRLEEGETVQWKFPEFDMRFPVTTKKVNKPAMIEIDWEGAPGKTTNVKFQLESKAEEKTLVRITEGSMNVDEEGLQWFGRNSEGWANFLACMKAYLEFGINLRKGGYDFMIIKE
ncbi:SRPBCC domain-containing protein [Gramella lutea]|uniref:SRPBCC domain-containing protein n=1 Tax=Christiangramia lutea TaxID=1607951 RepID=A0A9X1V3G4_9FLAO|nr:SRPBCC domain-containing protein [Christiangramia lutea]MCH4822143.1 SRPBCC domain-containing protein [Christiangramia lutea]